MVDLSFREDEASVRPLHLPSGLAAADWGVEWRHLDRVCLDVIDCPHSTPRLTDGGPFVVRSQDILTGVLRLEQTARVSEATYAERIGRAEPRYGDLLYSREGTYFGIAAEVPQDVKLCLGQRMVLIRPNPDIINHRYLRLWLNSPTLARHIHGHKDGSVAQRLNLPTIRSLPVPWRPVCDQDGIASMLGSLDDKIQLNRETSRTLEALAAAIFRSWFVDFDPVVAKAEGRPPFGMDPATAALFPDGFEGSPLGPIPLGWRNKSVGDVASINRSLLGPSDPLASLRYVEISGVDRGDVTEVTVYPRGTEPSRARRRVSHGDTVLSTVRPERKAYFLAFEPESDLIVSTGFAVVSPADVPWTLLHAALTQPDLFDELGRLADGGAYPAVNASVIAAQALTLPRGPEIVGAFHTATAPLLERAQVNRAQNTTLAELRDLLLPKLLSGELRVRDAEKDVAMVV